MINNVWRAYEWTYGSGECMGDEEWRMYCVHWNTLNARLARKSRADSRPTTGRSWKPVFSTNTNISYVSSAASVNACNWFLFLQHSVHSYKAVRKIYPRWPLFFWVTPSSITNHYTNVDVKTDSTESVYWGFRISGLYERVLGWATWRSLWPWQQLQIYCIQWCMCYMCRFFILNI